MTEKDYLEQLLNIPEETQTIEFKRLNGPKVVSKIVETMVAMANTDGGRIVVGIEDPEKTIQTGIDRVYGIEENYELFDSIKHELKRIIPPVGGLMNPRLLQVVETNKTVAVFEVPKATESFHSIEDAVYIRLYKSNKRLSPHEVVKMSYAKGFERADRELVDVDFELLDTQYYDDWRRNRGIAREPIEQVLFKMGLARRKDTILLPTRAAVLLFAEHPTTLMETKSAVRILQYMGTIETYGETPNMVGVPITIEGPLIELIEKAQDQLLQLLRTGIEIRSGFITKYRIPERAVKEAITNAVIHRDYHIKRDIEIKIFEDRVEINNPGLLPYNITTRNIGRVRADGYRNDLIVKHLREFPAPPNLDQNEGVKAIQSEMASHNLYPATYWTYPFYQDAVEVGLFNELKADEWDKVREYLVLNKYINNKLARDLTGVVQVHKMTRLFNSWVNAGLLIKIEPKSGSKKLVKYKLSNADEIDHE